MHAVLETRLSTEKIKTTVAAEDSRIKRENRNSMAASSDKVNPFSTENVEKKRRIEQQERQEENEEYDEAMKSVKVLGGVSGRVSYYSSDNIDALFKVIKWNMQYGFVINGGIQQMAINGNGAYGTKYTVTLTRDNKPKLY